VYAGGVGRLAKIADELGVLAGRPQPPAFTVHRVLDVEADGAGVEQARDQASGRFAVTRFDVDGDRPSTVAVICLTRVSTSSNVMPS
jgi:hypothetical protein